MIGDENPCGSSTFQMTFLSGPNSAGSPFVSEMPDPFGPRKRDQSVSLAGSGDQERQQHTEKNHYSPRLT